MSDFAYDYVEVRANLHEDRPPMSELAADNHTVHPSDFVRDCFAEMGIVDDPSHPDNGLF
jgi:hypothetical protein